jgi:hypothetical protein
LTDAAGKRVGQAFMYDGAPSWVFVSVDQSGAEGTYTVVCTGPSAGPLSWPNLHIADGHGAVGWTAQGDVRGLDRVQLVNASGHAVYWAQLDRPST